MNKTALPTPGTFPHLLLTLTALSGEFPSPLVGRLPGSVYYKRNAVTALKKAGLLYKYSRDRLHGLRLTSTAKDLLLSQHPERYESLLTGDSLLNAPKYAATRRARLHRMAEVLVAMCNAGAAFLPWEKADIFQSDGGAAVGDICQPTYYTSLEIKGGGDQGSKFTGSRATGVLFTGDSIYLVFNTGTAEMKWNTSSEARLKTFITYDLCCSSQAGAYMLNRPDAIMFASDMGQLEVLLGGGTRTRRNQMTLDDFEHFHYLTINQHGEGILRLLCDSERTDALDGILMEGYTPTPEGYCGIDCDAVDADNAPVLFGYTCDMPRIRRFHGGLSLHDLAGTLFCFDFQADALRRVCGPQVQLQCIDFDAVDRLLVRPGEGGSYHNMQNDYD